jgi:hemoglobin
VPGWDRLPTIDPREDSMLPWTDSRSQVHEGAASPNGHAPATAAHQPVDEHGFRQEVFDLIGGARAIEDMVETFYEMIMGDPELAPYFRGFSVGKIKQHQQQFLTAVTGGPNIYVGRPLRVAHTALQITSEHFDRMSGHLDATLTVKGVDPDHRTLILARVAALRRHIVAP